MSRQFVTVSAAQMLRAVQIPVYQEGSLLHLAGASLGVEDACSGIRSFWTLMASSIAIAHLMGCGPSASLIMGVVAIPLAVLQNLFRVFITALFTGMVLALQTATSLARFGAKPYTGSFVGLAFVLELGPVLTALVVAGRVGAGISAEIGSMTVSEQGTPCRHGATRSGMMPSTKSTCRAATIPPMPTRGTTARTTFLSRGKSPNGKISMRGNMKMR